ncbi:TonB-dependent receptor [Chroococcidiopsis sp.]|uniref:TonB-dependent receptor n=1 Tax=Chroococcidiopsis sp. TaxID=3088168 RepID=UPI003F39002D
MTTNSYAKQMILHSIRDRETYFCDGELGEFIEAAKSLGFDYDYCKTEDGFDFMAWNPGDEEEVAKIKL